MDKEQLDAWYHDQYPDDPDYYNDHWLHSGYKHGRDADVLDVWEGLQMPEVRGLLNGAGQYQLRRYARAFEKGLMDRIVTIDGQARDKRQSLLLSGSSE